MKRKIIRRCQITRWYDGSIFSPYGSEYKFYKHLQKSHKNEIQQRELWPAKLISVNLIIENNQELFEE